MSHQKMKPVTDSENVTVFSPRKIYDDPDTMPTYSTLPSQNLAPGLLTTKAEEIVIGHDDAA